MEFQVAMLFKAHMCAFCRSAIGERYGDCVLTYYAYETLTELTALVERIKQRYDGVVTSGMVPHALVQSLVSPEELSAAFFGFDVENTYRILLEQSVCRPGFSLSRIGLDFVAEGADVARIIADNQLPALVRQFEDWLRGLPLDQLDAQESGIAQRYLERYRRGELDFIVTYFYSTVLELHRHGIDCFYLYPNEREIEHAFAGLVQSIALRTTAQMAVIRIDLRLGREQTEEVQFEIRMTELEHATRELLAGNMEGILLKRGYQGLELYTDSHVLKRLTDGRTSCFFGAALHRKIGFSGTVGYGVAEDFYHARLNAMDASNYASNFYETGLRSAFVGSDEKMLRLHQDAPAESLPDVPAEWLRESARRVRLAPETLLRILNVARMEQSDRISSTDLIGRLGVSLRTANRFLAHLVQGGLAQPDGRKPASGKGRPIVVYRIQTGPAQAHAGQSD